MARPSLAATRRPQILAAAARAAQERGFDGVRLADVAAAAGMSVGSVQHYFPSRELLLSETLRHLNEQALREFDAAAEAAGCDPRAQVEALVDHVTTKLTRWELWIELMAVSLRDPEAHAVMLESYRAWHRRFAEAIAEGVRSRAFKPARPVADIVVSLIALVDGLAYQVELGQLAPQDLQRLVLERLSDELRVPMPRGLATVAS